MSTFRYPNGQISEPWPMTLEVGAEWGEADRGWVAGVSRVTVGEQGWKCLKVALLSDQGKVK